jgi:hypothetical protein
MIDINLGVLEKSSLDCIKNGLSRNGDDGETDERAFTTSPATINITPKLIAQEAQEQAMKDGVINGLEVVLVATKLRFRLETILKTVCHLIQQTLGKV